MNSVILLTAFCVVGIQAKPSLPPLPVNPGGIGGLFRGPNLETIIKGPDGSQIVSEQVGGAVQTEARLDPIIVPDQVAISSVSAAPILSEGISIQVSPSPIPLESDILINSAQPVAVQSSIPLASPQPIAVEAPIPIATVPIIGVAGEPHIIETEFVDAPEVEPDQSSDLKGPSGTISVRGSASIVSGPASTTISEPVRKISVATVPIQTVSVPVAQSVSLPPVQPIAIQSQPIPVQPVAPSAVLTPPAPIAVTGQANINAFQAAYPPAIRTELVPPPLPTGQANINAFQAAYSPGIRTELVAPPPPTAQIPLISLGGTSGAGIADAGVRTDLIQHQIPVSSSTQIPFGPQNAVLLGQTVTSTQSPISVASSADIDISRINLGTSQTAVSNLAPYQGQGIISSTGAPISVSSQGPLILQDRGSSISDGRPSRPLLTTAAALSPTIGVNTVNEAIDIQNQAILSNQIISSTPGYTSIDSRDVISPQEPIGIGQSVLNTQTRPWLNVQPTPQQTVSSSALPPLDGRNQGQNIGPVASVLDTVLVQPTDPRNREVIEFGGRQLENVGNIVPVVRQPVLVPDFSNIQHIPTASVSQLITRNELDAGIHGRYGRDAKKKTR